jgi:tRNA threonylcarbamoyladenosine biosynthesis protein TsaB
VILLAIDTALNGCAVAVIKDGHVLASACEPMARGQAEALAPMVDRVLVDAGIVPTALERIAVTRGPGSFTGLRSGLAFARAVGLALSVSCVGVDTLKALRVSIDPNETGNVLAAIAVGGTTFLAAWQGKNQVLASVRADQPEMTLTALSPNGDGWVLTGPAALALSASWPSATCTPRDLVDIVAFAQFARGLDATSHPPEPLYLRGADAKLPGGHVAVED